MGETGFVPVGGELVAASLMMPMTNLTHNEFR